jgi:hypothetical protein
VSIEGLRHPALIKMRTALDDALKVLWETAGPTVAAVLLAQEARALEIMARQDGLWDEAAAAELGEALRKTLDVALAERDAAR